MFNPVKKVEDYVETYLGNPISKGIIKTSIFAEIRVYALVIMKDSMMGVKSTSWSSGPSKH